MPPKNNVIDNISLAETKISELQNILVLTDQKSLYTAAVCGLLLNVNRNQTNWIDLFSTTILLASVVFCLAALWPRSNTNAGEISWPTFAQKTPTEVFDFLHKIDKDKLLDSYSKQIHSLSEICDRKSSMIKISFVLVGISSVAQISNLFL